MRQALNKRLETTSEESNGAGMINVTRPYMPDINKYKAYIDRIYSTARLTNSAELHNELQERLQAYLGVKNLLLVTNGTLALQLAYRLLALKGEVITTPFSFVATTSSLVWEGLKPVFADIDEKSFNIDPEKIIPLISEKTSAIVPTHIFGNPCKVDRIGEIAQKYNLKLIYDGAHAFSVRHNDQSIYNFGDISIMSFHATKMFHTAEGGALVIKDDDLYEKARLMINFGIDNEDSVKELGINAKMNELQAAMGLCLLDDMADIIDEQERIVTKYKDSLESCIEMQHHKREDSSNYSYFPIVLKSDEQCQKVKLALKESGIIARRYFSPSLNKLNYLKESFSCANSESLSKRVLCLPVYCSLATDDLERIINIIKKNLN